MKFLTVSVALCCLAAHAAARDETFQAVLNFVDGEKLTMNFGPEYKSYYQKSSMLLTFPHFKPTSSLYTDTL